VGRQADRDDEALRAGVLRREPGIGEVVEREPESPAAAHFVGELQSRPELQRLPEPELDALLEPGQAEAGGHDDAGGEAEVALDLRVYEAGTVLGARGADGRHELPPAHGTVPVFEPVRGR